MCLYSISSHLTSIGREHIPTATRELGGSACNTSQNAQVLTLPQGFAMKLGTTPRFIPILLARNLKRIALSAIRNASVYASAVSYTPGPVSVSVQ